MCCCAKFVEIGVKHLCADFELMVSMSVVHMF